MLKKSIPFVLIFAALLLSIIGLYFLDKAFAEESVALEQAKTSIISLIQQANYAEAEVQIQQMLANYSEDKKIAETVWQIAKKYDELQEYDKALEVNKYNIEHFPNDIHAMWSQVEIVLHYIREGDFTAADAALSRLLTVFSNQPYLPKEIYLIGRKFSEAGENERAEKLYRDLIERGTATGDIVFRQYALMSYFELAKDEPNSLTAIDNLIVEDYNNTDLLSFIEQFISDFRENKDLPEALYRFGEGYFKIGIESKRTGNYEEANKAFEKAALIWEHIEGLGPFADPHVPGYTYQGLCICYQQLGIYKKATEYYNRVLTETSGRIEDSAYIDRSFISGGRFCGAYAVWHTLQYYGLRPSINEIISQIGVLDKGYSSIADIVAVLDSRGISAKGLKISFDNIEKVNMPFIQYLFPVNGITLGHFVLCIPTGTGKAIVLDGIEEPKLVDLSLYKADNITQTRWDGTAVLIEGIKADFKQSLIGWRILLLYSAFWLTPENDFDGFISQDLTNSEMKFLLGGCSDLDCEL